MFHTICGNTSTPPGNNSTFNFDTYKTNHPPQWSTDLSWPLLQTSIRTKESKGLNGYCIQTSLYTKEPSNIRIRADGPRTASPTSDQRFQRNRPGSRNANEVEWDQTTADRGERQPRLQLHQRPRQLWCLHDPSNSVRWPDIFVQSNNITSSSRINFVRLSILDYHMVNLYQPRSYWFQQSWSWSPMTAVFSIFWLGRVELLRNIHEINCPS